MPERIQLRRTKGWHKPEGAVVVARPSRWGNPWRVGQYVSAGWKCFLSRADAVTIFAEVLTRGESRGLTPVLRFTVEDVRRELRGRDLACWCPLDAACHADVLLEIANGGER